MFRDQEQLRRPGDLGSDHVLLRERCRGDCVRDLARVTRTLGLIRLRARLCRRRDDRDRERERCLERDRDELRDFDLDLVL